MVHVDEEDKRFEILPTSDYQNGNLVKTALINESGLYSLILSSKLPIGRVILALTGNDYIFIASFLIRL